MRDFSTLRKLMLLKQASGGSAVEDTATGNPVVFDGLAKALKELKVNMLPVQTGTGDPSPSNVRPITGWTGVDVWHTGKNLLNVAEFVDNKVWWQGVLAQGYTGYKASYKIPVVPNAKYTLYKSKTGQNQLQYFDADGQYISQSTGTLGYEVSKFTIPDGVYFIGINLDNDATATAQLEIGETVSEYEPYSGTTYSVTFPAVGKNLFADDTLYTAGNQYFIGGATTVYPHHLTPGTYTLQNATQNAYAYYKKEGGSGVTIHNSLTKYGSFEISEEGDYQIWYYQPGVSATDFTKIMLEKGSTPSAYEPYTSTVYGGYVDLVSGVLTAEYFGMTRKLSDRSLKQVFEDMVLFRFNGITTMGKIANNNNQLCSICSYQWATESRKTNHFYAYFSTNSNRNDLLLYFTDTAIDESTEFTVAIPFETPVVLATLTPQQITAFKGTNTIWSDANGNIEVKYLKKG